MNFSTSLRDSHHVQRCQIRPPPYLRRRCPGNQRVFNRPLRGTTNRVKRPWGVLVPSEKSRSLRGAGAVRCRLPLLLKATIIHLAHSALTTARCRSQQSHTAANTISSYDSRGGKRDSTRFKGLALHGRTHQIEVVGYFRHHTTCIALDGSASFVWTNNANPDSRSLEGELQLPLESPE